MRATLDFSAKTIQLEGSPTLQDIHVFQRTLIDWREWRVEGREPDVTFSDWDVWAKPVSIPKPRGASSV